MSPREDSSKSGNVGYLEAIIDLTAGGAGGVANVYVGQPLDTVKVKMQTFPDLYKNALYCFTETFKKEGIRGLYAGTIPSLASNVSENSCLFMFYGICQKVVQLVVRIPKVENLNPFHNACAGCMAAFFSSFPLCPTELVKCRLQAMREMNKLAGKELDKKSKRVGPWGVTKQILRTEGIPGLFRGLTSTFAREMPGYFFFFGGYEISRHMLTPKGKTKNDLGPVRTVICGGIGGVSLWVSIFPADVVKSRIQVQNSKEGFFKVLITIWRQEGVLALYNGLLPTVLRTFPSTGALFVAYEWTRKSLRNLTDIDI